MKSILLLLTLTCLAGCTRRDHAPAEQWDFKVAAQGKVYAKVNGMSRDEVIHLLGRPMLTTTEGEYWELRCSPNCYASVVAKFDARGVAYQTTTRVSFENRDPNQLRVPAPNLAN